MRYAKWGNISPPRVHALLCQQVVNCSRAFSYLVSVVTLTVSCLLHQHSCIIGFYNPNVGSGVYYVCPAGLASHYLGASACVGT